MFNEDLESPAPKIIAELRKKVLSGISPGTNGSDYSRLTCKASGTIKCRYINAR